MVTYVIVLYLGRSIICKDNEVFVSISHQSGSDNADEESYEVHGYNQILVTSPVFVDKQLHTKEYCITNTVNQQYELVMKDSFGDRWRWDSWIEVKGIYGNVVFKNNMYEMSIETHPLSLYYAINKQSNWFMTTVSATGGWTQYTYDTTSWDSVVLNTTRTVSGTQYFRKTFVGLTGTAAYEFRLNYKTGVITYINGVEVFRDNMPSGVVNSSTLATGSYLSVDYHAAIRPGNEIIASSVLAVEVHFQEAGEHEVEFDAFMAEMQANSDVDNCFVMPYNPVLTHSGLSSPLKAFNWYIGDYAQRSSIASNPVYLYYSYANSPIPYVNGLRIWPHTAVSNAPSNFEFYGTTTSASSDVGVNLITATNEIFKSSVMNNYHFMTGAGLFKYYKAYITKAVSSTQMRIYEMQPMICSLSLPTSIVFPQTAYTLIAKFQEADIRPSIDSITGCTVSPVLPTGMNIDEVTCAITGVPIVGIANNTFVVSSTSYGGITGSFWLAVSSCNGTMVKLLRTYKANAINEFMTMKEVATGTVIYSNSFNSGQTSNDWSQTFCLTGTVYSITLGCEIDYWTQNSFLYVSALFAGDNSETILRARFDANLGLNHVATFNAQYAVPMLSQWFYKFDSVPTTWYDAIADGWKTGVSGSFPLATNKIQLFKTTFVMGALDSYSGVALTFKYKYGIVVYMNGHEAFRNGVTGDIIDDPSNENIYNTISYHGVTLPVRTMALNTVQAVDYIIQGINTIAVAIVAVANTQTTVYFDATLRMMTTMSSSRVIEYTVAGDAISGSYANAFGFYYNSPVYYTTCRNNWLRIIFDNERREWISSVVIQNQWNKNEKNVGSFSLEARNANDEEWTPIRSITGLQWSQIGQQKKIWLPNNKPYNQYRFVNFASNTPSDCNWKINRIDMFSDNLAASFPTLVYPQDIIVYKDVEMAEVYTNTDVYSEFSILPVLPDNLSIDTTSGMISGTAKSVHAKQEYTITAHLFTGAVVHAITSITIDICTSGKSLITLVARTDNYPSQASYKLFRGRGTSGQLVSFNTEFKVESGLNYVDSCLADDIYTFQINDSGVSGWNHPAGFMLTVDVGEMRFELGQVPSASEAPITVETSFSSYLPFQVEYTSYMHYRGTAAPPANWNAVTIDEKEWVSVTAAMIGSVSSVTTYLRKSFTLPSLDDYTVLNIRMKYAGGVVVYFNGNKVARFNLANDFTAETESLSIHDITVFSKFHIVLSAAAAAVGDNVIAFEIHRPLGQSSTDAVVFDATGVFGVNACSIVIDSFSAYDGTEPSSGELNSLFDLNPSTYAQQPNEEGTFITWTVENLEGTRFNSFAMQTPYIRNSWGWSLYGRHDVTDEMSVLLEPVNTAVKSLRRTSWATQLSMIGMKDFRWEVDDPSSSVITISTYIFEFCKTSSPICPAVGEFPSVMNGQKSPALCDKEYTGYRYRECSEGKLGDIKTDDCVYKIPKDLHYDTTRYTFVKDVFGSINPPTYTNIITKFYFDDDVFLPIGLNLDEKTGAITGIPTDLVGVTPYTVYGSNPSGAVQFTLNIIVRKGECLGEGVFTTTKVGETAIYLCSSQGSYVGSMTRVCALGKKDGEWQQASGVCFPIYAIVLFIVVVILVILVIIFVIIRISRRKRAVGGVKGKSQARQVAPTSTPTKKTPKV